MPSTSTSTTPSRTAITSSAAYDGVQRRAGIVQTLRTAETRQPLTRGPDRHTRGHPRLLCGVQARQTVQTRRGALGNGQGCIQVDSTVLEPSYWPIPARTLPPASECQDEPHSSTIRPGDLKSSSHSEPATTFPALRGLHSAQKSSGRPQFRYVLPHPAVGLSGLERPQITRGSPGRPRIRHPSYPALDLPALRRPIRISPGYRLSAGDGGTTRPQALDERAHAPRAHAHATGERLSRVLDVECRYDVAGGTTCRGARQRFRRDWLRTTWRCLYGDSTWPESARAGGAAARRTTRHREVHVRGPRPDTVSHAQLPHLRLDYRYISYGTFPVHPIRPVDQYDDAAGRSRQEMWLRSRLDWLGNRYIAAQASFTAVFDMSSTPRLCGVEDTSMASGALRR
ncbi:hypothetical protein VTO73DRAFT_10246 [Trametes versicolor]